MLLLMHWLKLVLFTIRLNSPELLSGEFWIFMLVSGTFAIAAKFEESKGYFSHQRYLSTIFSFNFVANAEVRPNIFMIESINSAIE